MTQEKPVSKQSKEPEYTWDDTIAAIGTDFAEGEQHTADLPIEYAAVTRYNEVYEFGNLLYWDAKVAKKAGYRGVVVPWSGIKQTFSYGGFWRPGQPTHFPLTQHKDTRLLRYSEGPEGKPIPKPPTTQGVATDMEIEFFEPVCVGDQMTTKGRKLVSVRVRETRVGYGAFTASQSEVFNQRGQLVARLIGGGFAYNPGKAPK